MTKIHLAAWLLGFAYGDSSPNQIGQDQIPSWSRPPCVRPSGSSPITAWSRGQGIPPHTLRWRNIWMSGIPSQPKGGMNMDWKACPLQSSLHFHKQFVWCSKMCFVSNFLEGFANSHDFSHTLHGRANACIHSGELLQVPPWHLLANELRESASTNAVEACICLVGDLLDSATCFILFYGKSLCFMD